MPTSVTQPMNEGIIANLKTKYRHIYVRKGLLLVMYTYEMRDVEWSLRDAAIDLRDAWTAVTPTTISHFFKKVASSRPTTLRDF